MTKATSIEVQGQQYARSRFIVPASGWVLIVIFFFGRRQRKGKEEREKEKMTSTSAYEMQDNLSRRAYQRVACNYSLTGDRHCLGRDSQINHVTDMRSRREHKLDRLKSESKYAANKAPTCALPMHTKQMSSRWRGVREVSRACGVGCGRRVQPRPFWKLAKG